MSTRSAGRSAHRWMGTEDPNFFNEDDKEGSLEPLGEVMTGTSEPVA